MSTSADDDGRIAVRLRSQVLGSPGGEAGEVVRLLPPIARAWVAAGLAEHLAADDAPETATVAAPETAMRRRGRPRSRG